MLKNRVLVKLVRLGTPVLRPFERRVLERATTTGMPPPIMVVGPPRSGTTLLYRILTESFATAHFVRLCSALPETPVTAVQLARRLRLEDSKGNIDNHYGQSAGWASPHEAGVVWRRWLPTEDPDRQAALPPREHPATLRATIAALSALTGGAPFVSKNLSNSFFLERIYDAVGPMLVIRCRRDPADTALSILRGRLDHVSRPNQWWSIRPPGWRAAAEKPVEDQIAFQISSTREAIKRAEKQLLPGGCRFIDATYEDFALEPRTLVDAVSEEYVLMPRARIEATAAVPSGTVPSSRQADTGLERRVANRVEDWHGE